MFIIYSEEVRRGGLGKSVRQHTHTHTHTHTRARADTDDTNKCTIVKITDHLVIIQDTCDFIASKKVIFLRLFFFFHYKNMEISFLLLIAPFKNSILCKTALDSSLSNGKWYLHQISVLTAMEVVSLKIQFKDLGKIEQLLKMCLNLLTSRSS